MNLCTKVAELYRDASGLFYIPELFSKAGDMLVNRAHRNTLAFGSAAFTVAVLGEVSSKEWISYRAALGATLAFLGTTLTAGYLSKYVAGFRVLGHIQTAEANAFELLEEKKKARVVHHANELWDRVYHYEAMRKYTPEEQAEELRLLENQSIKSRLQDESSCLNGILYYGETGRENAPKEKKGDDKKGNDKKGNDEIKECIRSLGKTNLGFLVSVIYGIQQAVPLSEKRDLIGVDIGKIVDWYNSAYFDVRGNTISNQYRGSRAIFNIKRALGWIFNPVKIIRHRLPEGIRSYIRDRWLSRISNTLAIRIGKGIAKLEGELGRHYINAQHFLWPTSRTDELVAETFGLPALKRLDTYRHDILKQIFHNQETAQRIITRGYGPNIYLTTKLRAYFDPEYMIGDLMQDPALDFKEAGLNPDTEVVTMQVQAKHDMEKFNDFVTRYYPRIKQNPEGFRAALIACYMNQEHIRWFLSRNQWDRDASRIIKVLEKAVEQKTMYTERLASLRQLHTLSLIELADCKREIKELMDYRSPLYSNSGAH